MPATSASRCRTRETASERCSSPRARPRSAGARLVEAAYEITNADRAIGARLGGAIAKAVGGVPPAGRVRARFEGSAGQSFGAFLTAGVELRLVGEANDYVGKSMSGGRIVVSPPRGDAGEPVLLGNTALYGATGGELFCAGAAGERFAVRNSGATAVVEGVGDHALRVHDPRDGRRARAARPQPRRRHDGRRGVPPRRRRHPPERRARRARAARAGRRGSPVPPARASPARDRLRAGRRAARGSRAVTGSLPPPCAARSRLSSRRSRRKGAAPPRDA